MTNIFNYIDRKSPIHDLTGASKFVCLLLWSLASMMTYDTRFLVVFPVLGLILFRISKIRVKDVSFMLGFMGAFLIINMGLLYVISPHHGTDLYGTTTEILGSGRYSLTLEQLFYFLNYTLKFISFVPIVLLFVCTTNPSEFAASLNRIGVPYSVACSVSLALRYIPDIQREYHEISQAQQARGIEMSKKANVIKRLMGVTGILIPLILSSMDRVEVVSNAMELRGFGKKKKRSWYMGRKFSKWDYLAMLGCLLLVIISLVLMQTNGGRFYNPFI